MSASRTFQLCTVCTLAAIPEQHRTPAPIHRSRSLGKPFGRDNLAAEAGATAGRPLRQSFAKRGLRTRRIGPGLWPRRPNRIAHFQVICRQCQHLPGDFQKFIGDRDYLFRCFQAFQNHAHMLLVFPRLDGCRAANLFAPYQFDFASRLELVACLS